MISLRTVGAAIRLALVALAFWGVFQHGRSTMDDEWKARWAVRDAGDQQAWALAEVAEREKEQARQNAINKVVQDGQQIIDQATADAASARAAAGSLQRSVDDLAGRLAAQAGSNSCTAATSAAATRAAMVLSDLLSRSVATNRELAQAYDRAKIAGKMCESTYAALHGRHVTRK